MRDILAHAISYTSFGANLEFASRLAADFDANLTAVYVCPSPIGLAAPYDAPDAVAALVNITRETEELAYGARDAFAAYARKHDALRTEWQVAEGYAPDVFEHLGNRHDLLVLGRDSRDNWATCGGLGRIVLGCGMPCFVVPSIPTATPRYGSIMIAWNGSAEAMRAVHSSLPFLARATRILVVVGERRETFSEIGWMPPFELSAYLERHGLHAEFHPMMSSADGDGAALLTAASDYGADMIVMGAYGRSRFREWVLGGATRHVLEYALRPVLMRH